MLQIFWASDDANSAVKWTAVALVSAQLVVGFAWPVVWNANQLRAATFMILGMLALLAPGIVLTSRVNTVSAALWSVMAVWLVFALLLSASSVDKQVSTQ
jgi:tryptophan-rich sensory protein